MSTTQPIDFIFNITITTSLMIFSFITMTNLVHFQGQLILKRKEYVFEFFHILYLGIIILTHRSEQMDKLTQAKELSIRGNNYENQGNYQFAIRCYERIVGLLTLVLGQASSQQSVSDIQHKIEKYVEKIELAKNKITQKQQKQKSQVKVPKFGFPTQNQKPKDVSFELAKMKQEVKQERSFNPPNKYPEKNRKKHNQKMKVDIHPAVQQLIVKKLDIGFKDVVGLNQVKMILEEAVIRPRQRPDLFTGIRSPPKGILLYGPPGNGKTYLCKALAKQSECTFFALSASSIMNRYVGQSQKMIKRIFAAAQQLAPSIIFIDEIDSMLTARSENENQASRRLKTQFLVLMDGINSPKSGDVLVIGATNLPKELDTAAKRRFSKMIYLGNPDSQSRKEMLLMNMKDIPYDLSKSQMSKLIDKLDYYSASEIRNIIAQTSMIPLRQLQSNAFKTIKKAELRKINFKDFKKVLEERKPILSREELQMYKQKI